MDPISDYMSKTSCLRLLINGCKVETDLAKTMQILQGCEKVYKGTFKTTKIISMSGCEKLYMGKTKTTLILLDLKGFGQDQDLADSTKERMREGNRGCG